MSLVGNGGYGYHPHSWADRSKQGLQDEDDRLESYFCPRLERSAAKIWMSRVPRGLVPSYGLGATDHHSLTEGGNKPGCLTSVASVSREEKCRLVARLASGGMETWEAGSAAHPHEHDSCRSSLLSGPSKASDQRDLGANAPSSAQLEIGVSRPMTREVLDCRASRSEDVEGVGARRKAQSGPGGLPEDLPVNWCAKRKLRVKKRKHAKHVSSSTGL